MLSFISMASRKTVIDINVNSKKKEKKKVEITRFWADTHLRCAPSFSSIVIDVDIDLQLTRNPQTHKSDEN